MKERVKLESDTHLVHCLKSYSFPGEIVKEDKMMFFSKRKESVRGKSGLIFASGRTNPIHLVSAAGTFSPCNFKIAGKVRASPLGRYWQFYLIICSLHIFSSNYSCFRLVRYLRSIAETYSSRFRNNCRFCGGRFICQFLGSAVHSFAAFDWIRARIGRPIAPLAMCLL